ncbi:MAG: type II secretion system F family protein [Acidimicrobiia bacterium]|nr:type II secretion system F family protein [Acidimicrobiia bacterium]
MLFAVVAVGLLVGALVFYVGNGVVAARQNSGNRLTALRTRDEVLDGSFSERALAPMVQGIGRTVIRFTPTGWVGNAQQKLILAGWADRMDGNTWAAVRIISVVGSFFMWLLVQSLVEGTMMRIVVFGVCAFIGFFGPVAMLNSRIDKRRKAMEKELPDVIDLLVISVEAGLGFDAALGRVVQNVPGEISREFSRTLQETRVGVSRSDALRNLTERTDVDDLNTFVLALIQADQFGVSIARVLRVQAEEMRIRRRQRAQERAMKAPVKLVFPLVLFIFPALFVVILGPAAISIMDSINGGSFG